MLHTNCCLCQHSTLLLFPMCACTPAPPSKMWAGAFSKLSLVLETRRDHLLTTSTIGRNISWPFWTMNPIKFSQPTASTISPLTSISIVSTRPCHFKCHRGQQLCDLAFSRPKKRLGATYRWIYAISFHEPRWSLSDISRKRFLFFILKIIFACCVQPFFSSAGYNLNLASKECLGYGCVNLTRHFNPPGLLLL